MHRIRWKGEIKVIAIAVAIANHNDNKDDNKDNQEDNDDDDNNKNNNEKDVDEEDNTFYIWYLIIRIILGTSDGYKSEMRTFFEISAS